MRKLLTLGACVLVSLAACATAPQPQPTPAVAQAAKPAAGCVPQTATRLSVKDNECAGFGFSHDQTQLNTTGLPYADQQLRLLDPSVH